ncbi:Bug family tripartite tricarboxylate transporter substrate binding protein [Lacisediminimonas profundi]|uniref:Bug family tripartite tricarboxylate transporter substrate binding protein n=1 Tax=Lacisediminimonas profundi TaxID=2603856 RepID=UPI00124AFB98|nr:tripartite tricarboxylate transporter substrate binding protein [Lacisediminimonas profundi]
MKHLAITIAAAAAVLTSSAAQAQADAYPNKPVSIVVPYAAGGPVDSFMRAVGPKLSEALKQPVLIVNKPGANEIIAAEFVARSAPDGYTLFAGTESAYTMNPHLYKKLPYNPQTDFAPISRLVSIPLVFFVPKSSPANTLKEFIAVGKKAAAAGKPMTYGSSGAGGIAHLPMAMFEKQENVKMMHVAYKGAAPLIPDVMAGHIDAATLAVSVIEQHVKTGSLKALAVSSEQRSAALPDVPTFKELGVADINAVFNIALTAPAATPPAIVNRIAAEVRKIVNAPDFKKRNVEPFSFVAVGSTPAELKTWVERDYKIQAERVKASGASLD